jgi:hypothetical protein
MASHFWWGVFDSPDLHLDNEVITAPNQMLPLLPIGYRNSMNHSWPLRDPTGYPFSTVNR